MFQTNASNSYTGIYYDFGHDQGKVHGHRSHRFGFLLLIFWGWNRWGGGLVAISVTEDHKEGV